ncbi:MAG: glycosyltransferase [Thermoplasmata archaeon]|nr:glycosyltransferase [Thermoplasmata archaeon]
MTVPDVTVLTVTRGRPARLRRLLESLAPVVPEWVHRIVVVDDSPEPGDLLAEFPDLPIRQVNSAERLYISRAKNLGLREARDRFVYFIDDDNIVGPTTFPGPVTRMRSDPNPAAVMPSVLYHRRPELVWVYATPFRPDRWGFELIGRNAPRDLALEGKLVHTDALPNASLVRRTALEAVGGLDESLPVNSSADLCLRLQRYGGGTWADTGAFIRHDVDPPGERGFWAQHSVDPDRLDREIADWFVFHRRLREGGPAVRMRSLWHAAPFLLASELAFIMRSDARWAPLSRRLGRGVLRGLGPLPPPRRGVVEPSGVVA